MKSNPPINWHRKQIVYAERELDHALSAWNKIYWKAFIEVHESCIEVEGRKCKDISLDDYKRMASDMEDIYSLQKKGTAKQADILGRWNALRVCVQHKKVHG